MYLCVSLFLLFAGGLPVRFRCHSYPALDDLALGMASLQDRALTLCCLLLQTCRATVLH